MSRADDLIERLQAEIVKRDARITELEAQAGDGTSSNKYRAELSAIKAGYGEAVAFAQGNLVDIFEDSTVSVIRREADDSYTLPLYLAPPASADAVSVPRELLERLCSRANNSGWQTWNVATAFEAARELRALLAQSQEVKS